MASFAINTRVELWKCRKTAAYWLTIIAAAFIPLADILIYVIESEHFLQKGRVDPWPSHLRESWQPAAALLLPMYVILVTSLVVQLEYRNNTWKQVYASPRSYADIFFSKFCVVHLLILSCLILFNMFLVLAAYIANIFIPEFAFFKTPVPWKLMLSFTGKLYVSVLAMTAIQYWISLRLRNYIAPLGIGLGLLIIGLTALQWDKIVYYPYTYVAVTFFKDGMSKPMGPQGWYSVFGMAGILLLSFWDTINRKERG
jgi:lantibiotic transport system permease protein